MDKYLQLTQNIAVLSGLFHDWIKASEFFITKLRKNEIVQDPLRHDWLSAVFFSSIVGKQSDLEWLQQLIDGNIPSEFKIPDNPLENLPDTAAVIFWLILTHHRLPIIDRYRGKNCGDFRNLFKFISAEWGYQHLKTQGLEKCFKFPKGLPDHSPILVQHIQKAAQDLYNSIGTLEEVIQKRNLRTILTQARMALMLADHFHSSQDADPNWPKTYPVFANTYRDTGKLKQRLDEHLVGVANQAAFNVKFLHELVDINHKHQAYPSLVIKSPAEFQWQEDAVTVIRNQYQKGGFFGVSIASTGTGKTLGNAKIMQALSKDGKGLHYTSALGLRTLTLQTGLEYRDRIGLTDKDMAVLIGSTDNLNPFYAGSESEDCLLDNELIGGLAEAGLSPVLRDEKSCRFFHTPVVVCTIDHLVGATETRKGGRYILPLLRLMSSDLVIDEIDNFSNGDSVVIGHLIHLAGMLGRKVLISSATIPPDMAEGYFNAYQAGWEEFCKNQSENPAVSCFWTDEFGATLESVETLTEYRKYHQEFVEQRVIELAKKPIRHRVNIGEIQPVKNESRKKTKNRFFKSMTDCCFELHKDNYTKDAKTGKLVSIGVIRVNTINTCVSLTKHLLKTKLPPNIDIRTMAYHSQQVMALRNVQETHLDNVLKRHKGSQAIFDNPIIREHVDNSSADHVIFILVATSIEEVGRDHDFDWGVIEPSSFRAIIQLIGRILRHRMKNVTQPNVTIMQYNLKGLLGDRLPFKLPGYESTQHVFNSHDITNLIDKETICEGLNATPRITKNTPLDPQNKLVDLEHTITHETLSDYTQQGPESLAGWVKTFWWMTATPQKMNKFRSDYPCLRVFLIPTDDGPVFFEKTKRHGIRKIESLYGVRVNKSDDEMPLKRLWLHRDFETIIDGLDLMIHGEINLPTYGKDKNEIRYEYSDQFGLIAK